MKLVTRFYFGLVLIAFSSLSNAQHLSMQPSNDRVQKKLPEEIVTAIRQGQGRNLSRFAERFQNHLISFDAELERSEKRLTRNFRDGSAIVVRKSMMDAKRTEIELLRQQIFASIDEDRTAKLAIGDIKGAETLDSYRQKLNARFELFINSLIDISLTNDHQASQRMLEQLRKRIQPWVQKPEAGLQKVLPQTLEPSWRLVKPVTPKEQAPAGMPPSFVADILDLFQARLASQNGFQPVVARATPTEASSCNYNPSDLANTEEAPKFDSKIQALAQELGNSPVRIFEWVSQNITFEPYYGSLKGASGALQSRSGGATDQASLLIALLRASNIPARYVRGQVAIFDEDSTTTPSRGARWIGSKNNAAASNVLARNSNPNTIGADSLLSFEHVWVQACIPYSAYRGVATDDSGHRWIPLDASYKDNRVTNGIAVDGTLDFDYVNFLARRLDPQGQYRLALERFEEQVLSHIRSKAPNFTNNTLADVAISAEVKRQTFDILPIVPPYEVLSYTSWSGLTGGSAETALLPDRHKYRAQMEVRNESSTPDPGEGNLLWQKTVSVADVALKRLTLGFKGASAADQSAYDAWFASVDPSASPVCASQFSLVPEVKSEGNALIADAGGGSTVLCSTNNVLQIKVVLGELEGQGRAVHNSVQYQNIAAANIHGLHVYAWHLSDEFLQSRAELLLNNVRTVANPNENRDGIEGEFLSLAANRYSRYYADATRRAGQLFGESGTSGISIGLTTAQVKVTQLFDLPFSVYRNGFLIDWPGALTSSSSLTDPNQIDFRAFKLQGFAGSEYESFIWQELVNLDAVSTTNGLQFATEQGYEILTLDASNWANEACKLTNTCGNVLLNSNPNGMSLSLGLVNDIRARYIDSGYTVKIPRRKVAYANINGAVGWIGALFYAENLSNGGNLLFWISGASGGITASPAFDDVLPPTLGLGIYPETNAPAAAQAENINSTGGAPGNLPGLTIVSGDPVNMLTGNLIHTERDVTIKGRANFPFVFERWYNSQNPTNGPFGFGWTHGFNQGIKFYGVEGGLAKVGWRDGTGGERFFSTPNHVAGSLSVGSLQSAPGIEATFSVRADGFYQITERSGVSYVFENISSGQTQTLARLIQIMDRNSNRLTLSYTAACGNQLCQVRDDLTRALTFNYQNNRITSITDWTGRQWQYEYSNGDLVTFKNPLAISGQQEPVRYQYYTVADGPKLVHAMKEYKLPRGNGMRFEYYSNGRMFRHTPFGVDGATKTDHATSFQWVEFRREARQIDALGGQRTFFFDAFGNPTRIIDEAGAVTQYTYDTAVGRTHLRLSKTDDAGMVTNYTYDGDRNLSQMTMPSGRTVVYSDYNSFGMPRRIKDTDNNYALLQYDEIGNLTDEVRTKTGVTPSAGTTPAANQVVGWTKYRYDASGNRVSSKRLRDWNSAALGTNTGVGPELETAFDGNRLNPLSLTRRGDRNGSPASLETELFTGFAFDALGRQLTGPDSQWYPAQFTYDALDRVTRSSDARDKLWDHAFDSNGNRLSSRLLIGLRLVDGSYATWDDLDRKTRAIDYVGNAVAWTYNPLGHVTSVRDPDGYGIGYDRDPLGRISGAYNELGHRVGFELDAQGRVRSQTDPNNLTTRFEFYHSSQEGQLKRSTMPTVAGQSQGKATEIGAYDGAGRPKRVDQIAADGTVRNAYSFYDELGRTTRSVGAPTVTGGSTRPVSCMVYNNLGYVTEIWAGSTSDTTSRDCVLDGVTIKRQATYTYDDFGRRLSFTDPLNRTWRWNYNNYDELVSSQTPLQIAANQSTTYTWERGRLLKSRIVPGAGSLGERLDYTYNDLGQVTSAKSADGSGALKTSYAYQYDAAHRVMAISDSRASKWLYYGWTPAGRLAKLNDSDGHTVSFGYDATGRLTSLTAPNNESMSMAYDAGGRLTARRSASGLLTQQSWYADGSLQAKSFSQGASVLTNHTYALDAQGRRSGVQEVINGLTRNWSYGYDGLDRLSSATVDGSAEAYGYDIFGNRTSKANSTNTLAYIFDAAHQLSQIRTGSTAGPLTGAAVHDASGRMIKLCEGASITAAANDCTASGANASTLSMAYNALDQLLSANRTGTNPSNETYAYDDQGRRISKTSGGLQTNNLYNGDAIHSQWVSSPSNTPTAVMVHGAGIDEPLMRLSGTTNTPNATARFYMTDGLGSVVGQLDENGTNPQSQRFDAWGSANNATNPSGVNTTPPYGFTGREPDGTGLIHYRARNYIPSLGIFTSRDPAGMVDAVSPYAYVRNRPTMLVDASGMYATGAAGLGGGAEKGATASLSVVSVQPVSQQSLSVVTGRSDLVQIACGGNESCWRLAQEQVVALAKRFGNTVLGVYDVILSGAITCATEGCSSSDAAIAAIGVIPGGKALAPLKLLHTEGAMSNATLQFFRNMDTKLIVESLNPSPILKNIEPLITKMDGTVMQGNHRIQVLMERGFDVDLLPRVIYRPN
jgi:RHS repeat-associated protein